MLLLVGLGNPGAKYEKNRHNIGYMAVDEIVRRHSFGAWRARFQALTAEGRIADSRILAMKPTTFMNESGRAVGAAMGFFKLVPADVIVIYDELDLVPGKVRVRRGGGLAGHNGLRSIDAHIGNDFRRVRVGIGHPGSKHRVQSHVLSDFAKAELPVMSRVIDAIADAAPILIEGDDGAFMSRVALQVFPPPPKPARPDDVAPPRENDG